MKKEPGDKNLPTQEREPEATQTGDGRDTTHGSDFAYRMNALSEKQWKWYNRIGGTLTGLLMGGCMFIMPGKVTSDSVRLLVAFVIGIFSTRIMESRAERSVALGKKYLAFSFLACMFIFIAFLLAKK